MVLVPDMKIKDLYFGNIDGKEEFEREKIEEYFYLDEDFVDIETVFKDRTVYIYGNKGTGKTSLLKYLEFIMTKKSKDTLFILFKEVKSDVTLFAQFKKMLEEINDTDLVSHAFWKWFFLSIVAKKYNLPDCQKHLIFSSNNLFTNIAVKFTELIKSISNFEIDIMSKIKLKVEREIYDKTKELSIITDAGKHIDNLQTLVKYHLNKDIYIFIDELETSTVSTTQAVDAILIKNLINSVKELNQLSKHLNIKVAVRSEIISNVFTTGDEVNKLLESSGLEIKWYHKNYNISHPLIKMIIKKMRVSMIKYAEKEKLSNEVEKIRNATDEEIFKRWFPKQLLQNLDSKRGNNIKILLNNTWSKPRDVVRLMNVLKEKAKSNSIFERHHYDEAIKEYSQKSWQELKEELSASLQPQEIVIVERALSNFKTAFTYEELVDRLKIYNQDTGKEIDKLIEILYTTGVIGCLCKYNNRVSFKYFFRGDKYLDKNCKLEVHKGLWKAFSLQQQRRSRKRSRSNFFNTSSVVFNDSLKSGLKKINKS